MDGRRILAGLAAVPPVLLAVLLGACGSGGSSMADPPVSSAPTTSDPSTTPQHETAEHFIQRWALAEKRMENTGKIATYLSMSHNCKACVALARDVRRYYAAGGYVHWGGWTIRSIKPNGGDSFAIAVTSAPTAYKTSATSSVLHLKGGPATHVLAVTRSTGSWQVTQKAQLAE
jgi:hypothetical protein